MKKKYLFTLILAIITINLSAQSPHFFGVTTNGGGDNVGTIFKTDTNGLNYSLVDTFEITKSGRNPFEQKMVEVGGKLYGTTEEGGNNDEGTLFEFDPLTGIYTVKFHFDDSSGTNPKCFLLLGSNGMLYGTARSGGSNGSGTLFEYNVSSNTFTRKVNFNYSTTGREPVGQMVEATTGVIYGVCTSGGGTPNQGIIYQYTISTNTLIKKDNFVATVNGSSPLGGLMKANNGKLYGMCWSGGDNNYGTLFEFDFVTDSLKKRFDFDNLNGRRPHSNLMQSSNGKLYGTTQFGGSTSGSGRGTLFEYDIMLDSLKKLQTFTNNLTGPGYYASGGLVESSSGKFLVCMRSGGPNSQNGVISEYTIATNTFVAKDYFDRYSKGGGPGGELVKSSITGKFYGVTHFGGIGDFGVVFEFDNLLDTIIKKIDFSPSDEGKVPTGDLLLATNGMIYGTTTLGGSGRGIIYEIDPNTNVRTKKAEFDGLNGSSPKGGMVEDGGKIYGTTQYGGLFSYGILYSYDISTSVITKLVDFNNIGSFRWSFGGLIKASNGKLYGTCNSGGASGRGGLFEYDIALDTAIIKGSFGVYGNNGSNPRGKLLQASNGKLYGTTSSGGQYNLGDIYEFDFVTDSIKSLHHFNDTNGANPSGGLIQTSSGKLFGMTTQGVSTGGSLSDGVIYEFDIINDSIIHRADFTRSNTGYGGQGELLEASNGKLYGMSRSSTIGINRVAIVVEFDPVTFAFTRKSRLEGSTTGSLIEVVSNNSASIDEYNNSQELLIYPNPTDYQLNIDTKGEKINSINVYDMTGKLILSRSNNTRTVDVSGIHNGTYIIQVSTDNGIAHSRFIKQ